VLIWFAALAPVLVAEVFRSPMIDYRVVLLGSLLPLVEVLIGPFVLHTLAAPVATMAVVMAATSGARLRRRRWLGLPIGMFFHLLLDGVWTDSSLFWWPFFGVRFGSGRLPEFDRPLAVLVVLELLGLAAAVWGWKRYDLRDRANLDLLRTTGQLDRAVLR